MPEFTTETARQIMDDAEIRRLIDRKKYLDWLLMGLPFSQPFLLESIKSKYANITSQADLAAIVKQALAEDEQEIIARLEEVIPPSV